MISNTYHYYDHGSFNAQPLTLHFIESDTNQNLFIKNAFKDSHYFIYSTYFIDCIDFTVSQKPCIIIIDISVQYTKGITLCKNLKQDIRTCYIPVMLLTDQVSDAQILEGLDSGCDDYILKTISPLIISGKIRNLINSRLKLTRGLTNEPELSSLYPNRTLSDREFISRAHQIVMNNIANSTFEVDDFAKAINISRAQLYRKINSISGQSVKEFIRIIRLKKAAEMLLKTHYNISEVAYKVGFNSIAYFTRSFNGYYGIAPSKYISKHKI